MPTSPEKKSAETIAKRQRESAIIIMVFVCLISATSTLFMMASIYSDCFGLGDFFKSPLPYVGFFDALVVGGFLLGLAPISFARFVAFAVAGFAFYCGWSAGEITWRGFGFDSFYLTFFNGYGITGWSHIAVALLTFGFGKTSSILLGLAGIACWITPITAVVTHNLKY